MLLDSKVHITFVEKVGNCFMFVPPGERTAVLTRLDTQRYMARRKRSVTRTRCVKVVL